MLLAGIVITIAFILTALTLSQVATLERQAAADKPSGMAAEWRFLHERLASNLDTAVTPDMSNETFQRTTWPAIVATFRTIEAEKGYDTVIRLGASTNGLAKTEYSALTKDATGGREYSGVFSIDGARTYTHGYDVVDDGLVTQTPCPDASVVGSCIVGVYVYLYVSDGKDEMEEFILFPTNTG